MTYSLHRAAEQDLTNAFRYYSKNAGSGVALRFLNEFERVAELLIRREDMPRSLAACMHEVVSNLQRVANEQSGDTQRLAGRLHADLQYGRIDEILATGLHAFLTRFLERVGSLGVGISRDFLVPVAT